jgi:hypothetical protein
MARRPAKTKAKVNPRRTKTPASGTKDSKPKACSGSREDSGSGSSIRGDRWSLKPSLKHPPLPQLLEFLRSRPPVS